MFLFSFIIAHPLCSHFVSCFRLPAFSISVVQRCGKHSSDGRLNSSSATWQNRWGSRQKIGCHAPYWDAARSGRQSPLWRLHGLNNRPHPWPAAENYSWHLNKRAGSGDEMTCGSVPKASIDIECQNLSQHLFNVAKDNLLCDLSKRQLGVKYRTSSQLQLMPSKIDFRDHQGDLYWAKVLMRAHWMNCCHPAQPTTCHHRRRFGRAPLLAKTH